MQFDAAIFDLDGTLINTQTVDYTIHRDMLASFGYDLSPQVYAGTFGMTREKMIESLLAHISSGPSIMQYMEAYAPRLEACLRERQDLLVLGADTLCQQLYLKGVPMALVTSSPRSVLQHITCVANLLPLFATTITSNDVERHKPDPDPYQKSIVALGVSNAFVFEDSLPGALSANRADLSFAIHKHAANTHAARIALTMKHFNFTFDDYHDPRILKLFTIS